MTGAVATDILDTLAEIGAIDAELWANKIVWSDHFVSNLGPVFERRKSEAPQKPGLRLPKPEQNEHCLSFGANNSGEPALIPTETDKVEETKVEETKAKETKAEERDGEEPHARVREGRRKTEPSCPSMLREGVERQADTVFLKPEEWERLCRDHGTDGAERIITLLDGYKNNHPGKCSEYRDDYKAITSWVIQRYQAERARAPTADKDQTFIGKLADMAREEAIPSLRRTGSYQLQLFRRDLLNLAIEAENECEKLQSASFSPGENGIEQFDAGGPVKLLNTRLRART